MESTGTSTPSSSKRERSPTPPPAAAAVSAQPTTSKSDAAASNDSKKAKVDSDASTTETPADAAPSSEAGPSKPSTGPRQADPNSNKSKKRAAAAAGSGGRGRKAYQGKGRERNEQDAAAKESGSRWQPPRESAEGADKADRLPKRKTAVLVGFSGTGYNGMQYQKGTTAKTIEGAIFQAFVEAGAVSKDNAEDPNKVSFSRAARTDAGVHASGNVVSLKLSTELPGLVAEEELIGLSDADQEKTKAAAFTKKVNSFLPDSIRIWGYTRVQNSFNARTACDSRMYEYLLPSHTLLPPAPKTHMAATLSRQVESTIPTHPFWEAAGDASEEALKDLKKAWRIDEATLARAREVAAKYEGTHNFHNFTVDRHFNDRAAQRYLLKMEVRDPVVVNGIEWVSFRFHGQSFMLHQIRKMMGLLILVVRSATPAALIPECYGPRKVHVPKAPSLGLLLDRPIFGSYNSNVLKSTFAAAKEPINFDLYQEEVEEFRRRVIYEKMREEEEASNVFAGWLQGLDGLAGPDFEYLNPKGVIPASAVRLSVKERLAEQEASGKETQQEVGESDEELDGLDMKNAENEG